MIFCSLIETLQMETIRGQVRVINTSATDVKSTFSGIPGSADPSKVLKTREFISWSVCFAIVSGLTGLLLFLHVGVTMETVTAALFYLSLAGLIYFISRIILLSRNPSPSAHSAAHELN
jgi:hypothetical protein